MAVRNRQLAEDARQSGSRQEVGRATADFIAGGAGEEVTLRANESAWHNYALWPRVMTDVSHVDTSVIFCGEPLAAPLCVSPMGIHQLVTPKGELASAAAARRAGVGYVTSCAASVSLEEVAAVGPPQRWLQIYWLRERDVVEDLVQRAEAAGYRGICLTVDAPVGGARLRDRRNRFEVPRHIRFANLERYGFAPTSRADGRAAVKYIVDQVDRSVTWSDLAWLRSLTSLPLLVKGVLRRADVENAFAHGADAVFVSNHGGRQLDHTPATAHALARLGDSIADRDVAVDGGVRGAASAAVALALGASVVGVGRPVLWALAEGGEDGATHLLAQLRDDLARVLGLVGARTVDELHELGAVSGPYPPDAGVGGQGSRGLLR